MLPLRKNEETGYLESNISTAFDSQTKLQFLDIAKKIREQGGWPNVSSMCKAVGISPRTFTAHLQLDSKFKEDWSEIVHDAADSLESKMFEYAQGKGGYMHMITWLRANQPGKWNPDLKVSINADSTELKGSIDTALTAIDAVIVDKSEQTVLKTDASKTVDK